MVITLSSYDQQRFKEIRKSLLLLTPKEHSFLKVELLFFEALNISRSYGSDPRKNSLLDQLQTLHQESYEKTKQHTQKSTQRESHIRHFMIQFKKVLSEVERKG